MIAWIAGAVGVGVLILSINIHLGIDKDRVESLAACEITTAQQQNVNKSNLQTIAQTTKANQAWADRFKTTVGDYNESIIRLKAQIADERIKREQDNAKAQAKLKEVLANDAESKDWSIQPVPDAIANIVQDITAAH